MVYLPAVNPVYNVPTALSGSSHRTLGLEPEWAMARNLQHLAATRHCTLGPMPINFFLESFLPISASQDCSGLSQSDGVFASVPFHAKRSSGITKPLVSTHCFLDTFHCQRSPEACSSEF